MKILLIDDSRTLRVSNEKALAKAGYEVLSAGDGEEGLRVARENSPDLIILDMMLPRIAGQDVLRTLKKDVRTKHVPVVILSGLSRANATKLLKQGAVEFIEKNHQLLENNSEGLVKMVEVVLSRANRLSEIGWH
jgi:DNA-binding response OmpR family regulator